MDLLGGRLRFATSPRERRWLLGRLGEALGKALSSSERRRLAAAAFAYRVLAQGDTVRLPHLDFRPPLSSLGRDLQFVAGNAASAVVVVPSWPFRDVMRLVVTALANSPAPGEERTNFIFRSVPAPAAGAARARVQIAALTSDAVDHNTVLLGLRPVRSGVVTIRFDPPKRLDASEESVGTFLDDCFRENPAQYDWFELR